MRGECIEHACQLDLLKTVSTVKNANHGSVGSTIDCIVSILTQSRHFISFQSKRGSKDQWGTTF